MRNTALLLAMLLSPQIKLRAEPDPTPREIDVGTDDVGGKVRLPHLRVIEGTKDEILRDLARRRFEQLEEKYANPTILGDATHPSPAIEP